MRSPIYYWLLFLFLVGLFVGTLPGCACPGERGDRGLQGVAGTDGSDGQDGTDGRDGVDGQDGKDGRDGVDGKDGLAGRDGTDAVIQVIDPCGKQSDYDEVILRLHDGTLVSYIQYEGGRFLVVLTPGVYYTTDKTRCKFWVSSDGSVAW